MYLPDALHGCKNYKHVKNVFRLVNIKVQLLLGKRAHFRQYYSPKAGFILSNISIILLQY